MGNIALEIKQRLGEEWLSEIYRNRIRTMRTRAYRMQIPEAENQTQIQHTLLGVELKVGKTRINCPDLSTARYLQVFARLGICEVAIPYDITKISHCADQLESSWQRTLLIFDEMTKGKASRSKGKLKSHLIKQIREEIKQIGTGPQIPEFRQTTKQRD
ncbi:MAG: hypothetical protein D6687_10650 [Acidobacteria bacterium]|jgi:hypothetical protein|nr:MAG: hypothetical protein D6687_10650 [Acidobacteriota bacterium]GIU81435.1 MAG: hypothetical protein KatS3mg006_0499 [Pyrinomonadaceae bacterium]